MISAWPSGGAERLLGRGLMKHGLCVYLVVIDTFALQREDFLGVSQWRNPSSISINAPQISSPL
ncbi:hypothetical protein V8C43DRAFT_273925 [Trichoderma afarasin]